MSTKNQQTQQSTFDPASMNAYHALLPQLGATLGRFMGTGGPMTSNFFQGLYGAGKQQAGLLGAGTAGNVNSLMQAGGMHPAVANALLSSARMQQSALGPNAFLNALQSAQQAQLQAGGIAGSLRPLQTGSTTTQTMSGLGTWLPQMIGAGMSGLMGYLNQPQGLTSLPIQSALPNAGTLMNQMAGIPGLDYQYMPTALPIQGMSNPLTQGFDPSLIS